MEQKTYTKRSNARRAGIAAGVPAELVGITVHKDGYEVRFGWKAMAVPAANTKKEPAPKMPREESNGVKRPTAGGLCAQVWDWMDAHPTATVNDAKGVAPEHGWNVNNVACEFYAWRKYHGIGRASV